MGSSEPDPVQEVIGKTSNPLAWARHFVVNVAERGESLRIQSTGVLVSEKTVVLVLDPKESELAFDMAIFAALEGEARENLP